MTWRRVGIAGVVARLAAGCAAATPGTASPILEADLDADPVALLPSGAEAVLDLDMAQLRGWRGMSEGPLRRWLTAAAEGRLARRGLDLYADVDGLAASLVAAGEDGAKAEVTLIVRGTIDPAALRESLAGAHGAAEAPVADGSYHGHRLIERGDEAAALLTPRCVALAGRAEVRRAIDVAAGEEEGLRRSPTDRALRAALAHAPGAKRGRPALTAAALLPAPLQARLARNGVAAVGVDWIAVAVAVGDGVDIGVVAGAHDAAGGDGLLRRLTAEVTRLRGQPALRALGLTPFLDDLRFARRDAEVHAAFRVDAERLASLLGRLEALVGRLAPAAPAAEAGP